MNDYSPQNQLRKSTFDMKLTKLLRKYGVLKYRVASKVTKAFSYGGRLVEIDRDLSRPQP